MGGVAFLYKDILQGTATPYTILNNLCPIALATQTIMFLLISCVRKVFAAVRETSRIISRIILWSYSGKQWNALHLTCSLFFIGEEIDKKPPTTKSKDAWLNSLAGLGAKY